jgi:hypothetical protein
MIWFSMTKGIDECMGVSELKSFSNSSWKPEFFFGDKVMFYADHLSLLSTDDKFHLEMKAIIEWVLFPQREFKQIPQPMWNVTVHSGNFTNQRTNSRRSNMRDGW